MARFALVAVSLAVACLIVMLVCADVMIDRSLR